MRRTLGFFCTLAGFWLLAVDRGLTAGFLCRLGFVDLPRFGRSGLGSLSLVRVRNALLCLFCSVFLHVCGRKIRRRGCTAVILVDLVFSVGVLMKAGREGRAWVLSYLKSKFVDECAYHACRTTHGGVASAREGLCRPARQMRRPPQRYRRETHNNECHRIFCDIHERRNKANVELPAPPPPRSLDGLGLAVIVSLGETLSLSSSSAERVRLRAVPGGKKRAKPSDIDGRCGSRNCKPASTIAGSQRRFSVHAFVGLFNDDLLQNTISSTPAIFTRSRSTRAVRVAFLLPPAFKQNNLFPTKQNKRAAAEGHKQFPQGPSHTEHTPSHTYHTTLMAPLLFFYVQRRRGGTQGVRSLVASAFTAQPSPSDVRFEPQVRRHAPSLTRVRAKPRRCLGSRATTSLSRGSQQRLPSQSSKHTVTATLFPPQQVDQRMRMLGVSLPPRIACPLPSKITLDLHGGDHIDNNKKPARQEAPATKSLPNRIPVPYLQSESGRAGPEKSAPLFESPSPRPTSPFRDHAPSSPCQLKQTGVALPDAETDAPVATSRGHDSRPTPRSHRCDSKKNATHEQGMLE